jgi:hypothetical protein
MSACVSARVCACMRECQRVRVRVCVCVCVCVQATQNQTRYHPASLGTPFANPRVFQTTSSFKKQAHARTQRGTSTQTSTHVYAVQTSMRDTLHLQFVRSKRLHLLWRMKLDALVSLLQQSHNRFSSVTLFR